MSNSSVNASVDRVGDVGVHRGVEVEAVLLGGELDQAVAPLLAGQAGDLLVELLGLGGAAVLVASLPSADGEVGLPPQAARARTVPAASAARARVRDFRMGWLSFWLSETGAGRAAAAQSMAWPLATTSS